MNRLSALVSVLVIMPIAADAQSLDHAKVETIDHVISAYMSKHGIPGLSIAVAVGGNVVWSAGFGLADVENSVPAKADTVYRTASMGKSITATAAMRLVEEGKLRLDEPVETYCPAFPRKQWKLKARHLLSHTGGIRHYGPHDREEQTSTIHYANVTDALSPFKDDPLLFEPGTEAPISEDASGRPDGRAYHGGSSPGVSGMLYIIPRRRLAVVMLSNLEDAPERQQTASAIADAVLAQAPRE